MKRLLLLLVLLILSGVQVAQAQESKRLVVSADGEYTSIDAALAAAQDGDVIEVRGGSYPAPITIDKAVVLEGVGWPIVDGGGQGTVITLAAEGSIVRGFEVSGSGVEPDQDHAGIAMTAAHTIAENNHLSDVLFGIFVAQADHAVVRGNEITSKPEYETGRKGDAIRLWYSQHVTVEENHVYDARDLVAWYSSDLVMRENVIEHGRYGIHLMYCDDTLIEQNQILNNSVGIYVMYSNNATIRENLIRGQRGPSGYALSFKDADNITTSGNLLIDNRVGFYLDGAPFSPQGFATHSQNIIAFNDVGVILQPAVRGNIFEGNTLWENVEQVSVQGGGAQVEANKWRSNSWSDYSGFDADGDGIGDTPYHAERLLESLYDREDRLRVIIYSPAAQAIEFAASTFPIVRPQPKFTDPYPRLEPAAIPSYAFSRQRPASVMFLAALLVLLAGMGCGLLARNQVMNGAISMANQHQSSDLGLLIQSVSKRYGKTQALNDISFVAHQGEAIALWGPNGAGKSTLIKAVLGLIQFEGRIQIGGYDVERRGKQVRSLVGYVPQESVFYDWTVNETMAFYARLKKADRARIPMLLDRLELTEHLTKPVPALSGGLKQRLALAVALLSDPPVLLLDEPTTNLDAKARSEYLALLVSLRTEGKLILFASHRLEEVDTLADHVLVLEGGNLAAILTPEALRQQITPQIELTMWICEVQRIAAVSVLHSQGIDAHTNGRGTVVARVASANKAQVLQSLTAHQIMVQDFEVEPVSWN